jgi:hypothetical protein
LEYELREVYTLYDPSPRVFNLASGPQKRTSYERALEMSVNYLTCEKLNAIVYGDIVDHRDPDVLSRLVVLRRSDDEASFSSQIISPLVRRLFAGSLLKKEWSTIRYNFRMLRTGTWRTGSSLWLIVTSKIPSLFQLSGQQLAPSGVKCHPILIDIRPTNVVRVHNALSAQLTGSPPGFYQIGSNTQGTFGAFTVTHDGRVIIYQNTVSADDDLTATGLDDLADAIRAAGREDLLPMNSKKKWLLVSVVTKRIEHLVDYNFSL